MENTTIANGAEVNKSETIAQPEVAKATNDLGGNLEAAVKDVVEQIRYCDEQAAMWQEKKRQFQTQMNETLERIQKQFNGDVPAKKAKATRVDKTSTVPDLIRDYLDKNGPQRTRDIRKFLLQHGKKTNPGVALSRMVKSGDLKHAERGVYKIA